MDQVMSDMKVSPCFDAAIKKTKDTLLMKTLMPTQSLVVCLK